MAASGLREVTCLACGHHVAVPFHDGGQQPLATIAWPQSAAAARALPRLPLDFVRCVDCGHVFNAAFDYAHVPYSEKPYLMFNHSANWSRFLSGARDVIRSHIPERPVVVEIGHGDGSFLAALAKERPAGRYIGFDPHGAMTGADNVEFRADLFDPQRHLAELVPDLIVSRHVLEHLMNPLGFLQSLSFAAAEQRLEPLAYFEVPCIDRVLETKRTVDFYYEHSSQFTTESFSRMLSRSSSRMIEIGHGYGGEVVFGFVRLGVADATLERARIARDFCIATKEALGAVSVQLTELCGAKKRVAIWGGTGKSAAFMCRYGVDAERFPVVVDSDPDKAGTFVPGTGQEIRYRDYLLAHPVDVIVIPPQWRAADILTEMAQAGIAVETVLIEHDGKLIDFHRDRHPYRAAAP